MYLPNSKDQRRPDRTYRADGSATSTPSLVLPEQLTRSSLFVQNLSSNVMYLEMGGARATATLTSGVVTSVTITNGGFGYTMPPVVRFMGGFSGVTSTLAVAGQADPPTNPAPVNQTLNRPAAGVAVLSTGAVASVTITDGGSGYQTPPFVFLENRREDPFGVASPFYSSTVSGIYLAANGGSIFYNGTTCPTDALSAYCASTAAFTVIWMA